MNDEEVIARFVGDYENKDENDIDNNFPEKDSYYPREGVKLRIGMVKLTDVPLRAYAKVEVTDDAGGTFSAKAALELAVFRVVGNTLVATDMELKPGLLFTETLTMTKDDGQGHKEMLHSLVFSDNAHGTWICKT